MLDKTFQPENIESDFYDEWESSGIFAAKPESNNAPFTVMMPPPNVTGSLHMGHALNMTLQDILTRYNRMRHKDALWQPGTDHAGIATQMVVERKLGEEGKSRRELGREGFLEKVWEWKEESGGTIVNQLRRLGTTPDWGRERFTMDDGLSKAVRRVFVQLHKEGLIYRDKRLVNWDPKLHTAVSDLEVEQREVKGHMWHIRYPIEGEEERFITIATTRPETMLGDTAIAVHPEDERYKDLVGKFAVLPICNRPIPIVADEYSDPEKGSGAVKITPAHDFNDFEVGKRHDLPMINIFDESACISEEAPEAYHGLDRFDARKKVLQELEELDLLVEVEDIKHAVPYDEKSKQTIIEPFLTDQWYVDAKTLAKPAIEAVKSGKTEFVPKQWENTYFAWMENIQPWCISRQLWWGHRIPAWYGPDNSFFVAETEEEAYEQARAKYGDDVILEQDEDVLDTWFSSALWPFSTLGWPEQTPELAKYYPGDVLITGFDIIFFWVARMMMMGLHFMDDVPFKKVYIHALVRDAKGQKMSKTKGNVIDPLDLIEKYGTDALRFTLTAMAAQGRDIKLSEDRVEGYRNFATKLWNAARYCEMNECKYQNDFDPETVSHKLNQWIICEAIKATRLVEKGIEEYRFNDAANAIYHFVWNTFCDWYIEFSKDTFDRADTTHDAEELRKTSAWVLHRIITILNPFMPFVTEKLNKDYLQSEEYLIASFWPDAEQDKSILDKTEEAVADIAQLQDFVSAIRSLRSDLNIPPGPKLKLYLKDADNLQCDDCYFPLDKLKRLARLEDVSFENNLPKGSVQTVVNGVTLAIPVADIIDLDQERERLKKQIGKLEQDIKKISQKLENEKFIANAPEEVIAEQKSRREEAETVRNKLSAALKQLEAA